MTDILHSARPPGAAEPQTYVAEPDNEAEALDAGDCEGAGAGEDGSETAGPAERSGGRRKGESAAFDTLSALAHFLAQNISGPCGPLASAAPDPAHHRVVTAVSLTLVL